MDEALLRTLTPTVIGILGRRGADFAAAEDAVQDALVEADVAPVWPRAGCTGPMRTKDVAVIRRATQGLQPGALPGL